MGARLRWTWLFLLRRASVADAASRRFDASVQRQMDLEEAVPVKKVFANAADTVCGGSAIRQFLVTPETATEVRNIPWSEVEAVAEEFLRTQRTLVSQLQGDVDRLKVAIPEREKLEAVKPLAADLLSKAMASSLSAVGAYGTLQVAKDTKCGENRSVKPRPTWSSSGAKTAAVADFKARVTQLLQPAFLVAVGQTVRTECEKLLSVPVDGTSSYCMELCQGFSQAAQDASTAVVAVTSKVDQLRKEFEQKTTMLRSAVSEYDQCKQLQSDLNIFKSQLEGLTNDVKDTHSKLMDAREALMDAQYELDDAEQALQVQSDVASEAAQLLQSSGVAADSALTKFHAVSTNADKSRKLLEGSAAELEGAKVDLARAQSAADSVTGLKTAVSDSMLKMVMYFDEAIRVPIRDMGLGERIDVDDLFSRTPASLGAAGATKQSLAALSGFCELPETQRALAKTASQGRDPLQLCAVGDVAVLQADLDTTVAKKVDELKDALREVQSWLCPYRGQTEAEVAAVPGYVKQGEPVGLREVIATFSKTPFYQRYLQHWKFKGKFLELYASLLSALEQAKITHASATSKLQTLTAELRQAQQEMAAAQTLLQQAIEAKSLASGKQQEAQVLLEKMAGDKLKLKTTLDNLEAAMLEAERRWKEAKLTLEQTHREGVSLVQLLQDLEAAHSA